MKNGCTNFALDFSVDFVLDCGVNSGVNFSVNFGVNFFGMRREFLRDCLCAFLCEFSAWIVVGGIFAISLVFLRRGKNPHGKFTRNIHTQNSHPKSHQNSYQNWFQVSRPKTYQISDAHWCSTFTSRASGGQTAAGGSVYWATSVWTGRIADGGWLWLPTTYPPTMPPF